MKQEYFKDFDFNDFWDDSDYSIKDYIEEPFTDETVAKIENELGYKLPQSYISLMKMHNGGVVKKNCFPTDEGNSWAEDHIAIVSISAIGRKKNYSLCGDLGSQFMIEEWGYPDIGVMICDTPTAGHTMVMLDYRECGKDGEPKVIHVDQEDDYSIIHLADNFEQFIRGLVSEDVYDTSEEDKQADLEKVRNGEFSTVLKELCQSITEVDNIEDKIRKICTDIVESKGYFALHADELSILMYDIQFWLYSKNNSNITSDDYLKAYSSIIAFGDKEFKTGGYAPAFIKDWLDGRITNEKIICNNGFITFTAEAKKELIEQIKSYNKVVNHNLIDMLKKWHEDDEFSKIIEAIKGIPENELDYNLKGQLARAYNNIDEYQKALDILIEIKEEGVNDVDWFYRIGYSYFFLDRFEEAVAEFEQCLELDPEDQDAIMFIKDSKDAMHFGKYLNFSNENPTIPSFLKRCDNFWNWFSNNEETLSNMVKNEKEYDIEDIIDFVSYGTNLIYDDISFNLGGDYEFNFTAEGKIPHFYLMPFLISRMPQEHKEKWKFSPFSKGSNGSDQNFNIYEKELKFSEVKVNIDFDKDSQTFSVIYFNEKLNELDYNKSINAFCIMIDLMLGEAISHSYVGCVKRADAFMETMIPLTKIEDKIRKHLIDNNITISENPDKNYCVYKMEPKQSGEFRMDVEIGTSCYQELISDYYSNNTNSYYDILECGAYPLYISVSFWENRNNLPETKKEIVKLRHTLEDKIQNTILGERGSSKERGIVIGGAMGASTFYIDLLLYDMEGFEEEIEKLIEKEYGLSYYLFNFRRGHKL